MGKQLILLLGLALVALTFVACSGGTKLPTPPPNDFDHMTAQVLGSDGAPLAGLAVRVEGEDTGLVTNASGGFILTAGNFPNGIDASNEITLGRNGVVLGSRDVVPVNSETLVITFEEGTGSSSLSGIVRDDQTGTGLVAVELTLFSSNGGLLQTQSGGDGSYSFSGIATGPWQLIGFAEGYAPEMAFLNIAADGTTLSQDLNLTANGAVTPGTGLMVSGTLVDSVTGAPIGGALVTVMADTGYIGIPEPGVWDDIKDIDPDGSISNDGGGDSSGGSDGGRPDSEPGIEPMPMPGDAAFTDPATGGMPWRYDPQYQETTTAADGSFEFDNEVIGYSLWFNYSADDYLSGNHYVNIDGVTADVDVDLELTPIVETQISGRIVDEDGLPVEGAYVEFIFSGNMGGPMPMDFAVPPVMNFDDMVQDGQETRDNTGAPPPPMTPGTDSSNGGWDDWAESPAAGGGAAPGSGGDGEGGGDSSNFDNEMMQKFRFEQRNGRGTSDINDPAFTGYLAATTAADGTFAFPSAPAGNYYIFASAYKHEAYSADFEAAVDPLENEVEIILPNIPVGSVEGQVIDEDGNPVEDVLVNATQPNVDPFTYTDASGHYRIDNVPVGLWTISGYKQGYLTTSFDTDITTDGLSTVNLTLQTYVPPVANVVVFTGRVADGSKWLPSGEMDPDAGISGADLLFTPEDPTLGSYFQHVLSGTGGAFSAGLINNTDYRLHVQHPNFQDLDIRLWADASWPTLDFQLWPISGGPGGGGGGVILPGGGGSTDPATGGGGDDGDTPDASPPGI